MKLTGTCENDFSKTTHIADRIGLYENYYFYCSLSHCCYHWQENVFIEIIQN